MELKVPVPDTLADTECEPDDDCVTDGENVPETVLDPDTELDSECVPLADPDPVTDTDALDE